jgi:four helix bundle protein
VIIRKFEDIEAWKKAREITDLVYKTSAKTKFNRDFGLREQIRRASVSIMNNIAEGFDSSSRIEFARFLNIAKRSASEVQSQLYIALDQEYISKAEFNSLYSKGEEIRKMITGFIEYLKFKK